MIKWRQVRDLFKIYKFSFELKFRIENFKLFFEQ